MYFQEDEENDFPAKTEDNMTIPDRSVRIISKL